MKPLTICISLASRCVVATLFVIVISGTCDAAPKELLGKSIVLRGTQTLITEKPNGTPDAVHITFETEIYVSTLGRVFSRRKGVAGGVTVDTVQHAPDEGSQEWQLNGNDLVRTNTATGLQSMGTISFDESFQTCQYSYQYKVVGTIMVSGETRRVQSSTIDSSSCTIQEGNPFAN